MKERGIIFNAEMVRAILDGRKTQTRRVIDWRRATEIAERDDGSNWPWSEDCENGGDYWHDCPFGAVGDRLWVRETFQGPLFDAKHIDAYLSDPEPFKNPEYCKYAANGGPRPEYFDADDNLRYGWRSSTSMPRWASRVTLEITGVRVERLQDISEDDAKAEGTYFSDGKPNEMGIATQLVVNAEEEFAHVWTSRYGADRWQANPWVWVIEFKRVEEK